MGLGTSGGGMVMQNISAGAQFGQAINSGDPIAIANAGKNYVDVVKTTLSSKKIEIPKTPKAPEVPPAPPSALEYEDVLETPETVDTSSNTGTTDGTSQTSSDSEPELKFERAVFTNVNTGESLQVLFNPRTYTVDSDTMYEEQLGAKYTFTQLRYKIITFTLFLDTSAEEKNVMDYVNVLRNFQKPSLGSQEEGSGSSSGEDPEWKEPHVLFSWGEVKFNCVIRDIQARYTKFTLSGVPVRAYVDITLLEKVLNKEGD